MTTKCMEIVNQMADEDQDALLAKLEQYQKIGVPASKAQKMAAKDMIEELKGERADFMKAVEEQHPDAEPLKHSTREEIAAGADAIKKMSEDERDNLEPAKAPGGWYAYVLYEARKILPKPSDKLKKLTERNSFIAHQDNEYMANVDGHYYGVNKWEDPDATGHEEDGKEPFVFAFNSLEDGGRTTVSTMESDVGELMAAIRKHKQGLKLSARAPDSQSFRKWFSDSKVIDENGDPLVLYHATTTDFTEFKVGGNDPKISGNAIWFTDNKEDQPANHNVGTKRDGSARDGHSVMPVYLTMKRPLVIDSVSMLEWAQSVFSDGAKDFPQLMPKKWAEEVQRDGEYDGIIYDAVALAKEYGWKFTPVNEYIVFSPTQIKSAIGNNGNFDPKDPDIRHSLRSGTSTWDMYEPSKFDDITYKMQNKMIDPKRVIEAITKYVGKVADDLNVYLQEELFHGRAAKRVTDFARMELQPMIEAIRTAGYELSDVEEYLHARHAKEANAVIATRNPGDPGMADGGSGMTNQAADDYMANLSPENARKLGAIAAQVDAITDTTRQMYVDYGLESQVTVDSWKSLFQHYIPLQREEKDGKGGMGIGQGFSVKGKETRGRTGSKRKVVDILANIAMQRERLVVRGEKNRVSKALVGLATANPNPEFWSVGSPPTERVYDPKTNTVVDRVDPMFKSRENVMVAKVLQPDGSVKEVAVIFNEDDQRAVRMAQALKNLDAGELEGLWGVSAKITRYFSAINTQYNPVFGVVNLIRDVQAALINLDTTVLANKKGRIAKDTASALAGIYQDMRAERKGQHPTSRWSVLWEEFQHEGGQTGFRQMFATSADRADELKGILNPDAWMDSKLGKIFTANGALRVPLSQAKKGAAVIFDWLSDYNESMENAVRLASYKAAIDQGMSKQEAASLAKNLTVNFNRKGQIGQQAGAVYAFFNAAMQGTARIGQTLFTIEGGNYKTMRLSSTGKKVVYGGMLIGTMQALALAAAGFGDDDPPEFLRARSLIIPTGGKTYISIPMPLGLNVLPGIGRSLTEFALGGFQAPTKRAIGLFSLFADNFNPIGNAGVSMQTLTPTVFDPLVAITENRDFTGKPIARVSSNKAIPGYTQYKDSATVVGKLIAEAINGATGGNAYVAGALSPTPDQIDYLLGQVTGGVGRELSKVEQTTLNLARGEDLPLYKIPLVGRFVGNSASQASQGGQFYANAQRLNELETEVKGMIKDGKREEAGAVMKEHPEAYLIAQANSAERQVQRLKREKRMIVESGASREAVAAKEAQITQVMTRLNQSMERLREKSAAN